MNTVNALVAAQGGYSPQFYQFYFGPFLIRYTPSPLHPTVYK